MNDDLEQNTWRSTTERAELVERLIAAEAKNRHYERILRDWANQIGEDPSETNYLRVLTARIETLEDNLKRLVRRLEKAA